VGNGLDRFERGTSPSLPGTPIKAKNNKRRDEAKLLHPLKFVFLFAQIAQEQFLQQLIAVDAGDERAGVVIVGDISGVLGKNIAHKLIYGVIAVFLK